MIIRNLDPHVIDALKERARTNGRSLEAELRLVLEREVQPASVYESSVPYFAWGHGLPKAPTQTIVFPKRPVRLPPFRAIKTKGKPASQMIIEDRR